MQAKTRMGILLVGALALVACTTAMPESEHWAMPSDASCERLTVGWRLNAKVLQEISGADYPPILHGDKTDKGTLFLSVVSCGDQTIDDGDKQSVPLVMAQAYIPVSPENAPRRLTGAAREQWNSLVLTMGSNHARVKNIFEKRGFAHVSGEGALHVRGAATNRKVVANIDFDDGQLIINADLDAPRRRYDTTTTFIGTGNRFFSIYYGPESGVYTDNGTARATFSGNTPLSDLELAETVDFVRFEEGIAWDLTFWMDDLAH